jgi:hypothetical protein
MSTVAGLQAAIGRHHAQATLVAFNCADQEEDRFFAGYVEQVEHDRFLLRYVNQSGQPGAGDLATAWFDFDEVAWIRTRTPYLEGLALLYEVHERFGQLKAERWKTAPASILKVLRTCLETHQACRVRFREGDMEYAIVKDIDSQFVSLELLGEDGGPAGELILRLPCITGVRAGGIESATMTFLSQAHNSESTNGGSRPKAVVD